MSRIELLDYSDAFVQRIPRYAVKGIGEDRWHTRRGALDDSVVLSHLRGEIAVAALGKWYPGHGLLDIDSRELGYVEDLRGRLALDDDNSMLCTSESPDSYYLLFRPTYNCKPPTLKLLNEILEPLALENGVELYPQDTHPIRLPFSTIQRMLDPGREHLSTWEEKMYWFNKLDEYDLAQAPRAQTLLALEYPDSRGRIPVYDEGRQYFLHGLTVPGERNRATFAVMYYLWRQNTPPESAQEIAWTWLKTKHNGVSTTWNRRQYIECKRDIKNAITTIWSTYDFPDTCHNHHGGWVNKADIERVFRTAGGSLVRARFLFHLVKHLSPRQHRSSTPIHNELLIRWSSRRVYLDRIEELADLGILKRGNWWIIGERAKSITLDWPFSPPAEAILVDGRAPDHLESTVAAAFEPAEFKGLLKSAGVNRQSQANLLRTSFEGSTT